MFPLILITIAVILLLWIFRYHVISLLYYLLVRFERRKIDFQLLGSLRDELIHERKKKMAGLEMILSSWEQGEEVQPRYEYFEELLGQLKNLVLEERRNLMAVTKDVFLWGKLWNILRRIEKTSREKREKSDVPKLRKDLDLFQNLIDEVIEYATKKFSFTLNEVVKESVKVVKIEKSKLKNIEIAEQLDDVGDTVRFSYDKFRDWQRVLTNLIRNAIEAVEAKQSGDRDLGLVTAPPEAGWGGDETVAADFSLRGEDRIYQVKVMTKQKDPNSVSVIIEDSGIGMDEITKSSFYKKGFTSGKEGGLGLGVSEECVEFINRYGSWEIESQKGIGTKITINIDREKAQKAE
ncbi:MAG: ATP-binding protein, partial [Candidatus Zixiibacteriota bacterium]